MKCVIGIDGGGTKTLLRLTDLDKNVLLEVGGGASNIYSAHKSTVVQVLRALIQPCFEKVTGLELVCVCICTAGVVTRQDEEFFEEELKRISLCENIVVLNDCYSALYANMDGVQGLSVTAGTGSFCFGKNKNGELFKTGGWGPLCSDEGSAYYMARLALEKICQARDNMRSATLLTELFYEQLQIKSHEELVHRIYTQYLDKKELASLSVLVEKAALKKDAAALEILEDCAERLFYLSNAVVRKLRMEKEPFRAVLNGSVLLKNAIVKAAYTQKMKDAYPQCEICDALLDAAWGAVNIALEQAGKA